MTVDIRNAFYKTGDGFVYNTHYKDGAPVPLKPGQEKYLLLAGIVSRTRRGKSAPADETVQKAAPAKTAASKK